jgi:hypothetical protein
MCLYYYCGSEECIRTYIRLYVYTHSIITIATAPSSDRKPKEMDGCTLSLLDAISTTLSPSEST